MSIDTFTLEGTYETSPTTGSPSGVPSVVAPISEKLQLQNKSVQAFTLSADVVENVQFPTGFEAHVVIVKTIGGKIRLRLTSADGTTQAVPVDDFFAMISQSMPVTAIDMLRDPGITVDVEVFLGNAVT